MPTKTRSPIKDGPRSRGSREEASFNRREAAYFADTSLRQVNKAIEEKVVKAWRPDARRVYLDRNDVLALALISKAQLKLPRQTKKQIYEWISSSVHGKDLEPAELALSEVLVIRLDRELVSMAKALNAYREARERYVTTDSEIQGGEPIVSGTRLPVHSVATRLQRGDTLADLAKDHPGIPQSAFEAARIYAEAHPRRGRPARPWREG
jgi:uncharacterized protein (DUF433 family)